MNRKFYFSILALALTIATAVVLVVGYNPSKAAPQSSTVAALPASDFVIVVDARRMLNETLPAMLVNHPQMMAKLNAKLNEFEKETGINARSFESIAIGGRISAIKAHDPHMVIIARGSFNADELLNTAFTALKNRGQLQKEEQQYEGKTIFLVSPPHKRVKRDAAVHGQTPTLSGEPPAEVVIRTDVKVDKMAVTALDANTLAFGNLESVRAAVDAGLGRGRVDDELVQMATRTPGAVVGFSGKIPQTVTQKAVLGSDPFSKYFSMIREFYGSFSLTGDEAASFIALRTETAEQASELTQMINSFKSLVALGAGHKTSGDPAQNQSLTDLLKGLNISAQGNEILIDLKLSQSSITPVMRIF